MRGLLAPLPLGAWGREPSAHPGAWASWRGASGYSQSRSLRPDWPRPCSSSWRASWCSGSPGKVVPASPRGCPRWQACLGVWLGGLPFEGKHPPLCLSAAPSAGARAGQRPWPPGEWCCHRLPGPGDALGGPRKSGRHTGSVRDRGTLMLAPLARCISASRANGKPSSVTTDDSRVRSGFQPHMGASWWPRCSPFPLRGVGRTS